MKPQTTQCTYQTTVHVAALSEALKGQMSHICDISPLRVKNPKKPKTH